MDALLTLLLPTIPALPDLMRSQRVFTWGGEEFPQEPISYTWGPRVELVLSEIPEDLSRMLPYADLREWVVLDVNNETLDLLEADLNGESVDWFGHKLEHLIELLLKKSDRWILIFLLYYDQIDNSYECTADECIEKLRANLRRTSEREGFIATSK